MFQTEEIKLPDEGPILGGGLLQVIAVLLLIVGWITGFTIMKNGYARDGWLIVIGSTIPAVIMALLLRRLFKKLGRAELLMKEEAVPMGWSGSVTYARPLRGGAALRSVEARLQCEEYVERGKGKGRREWREVVIDQPLTPRPAPMLEQLRVTIPIAIPAAGPASMDYVETKITWWVRLRLEMDGCPNTRSSFQIEVRPAVVSR
jgi:hypothetical protein